MPHQRRSAPLYQPDFDNGPCCVDDSQCSNKGYLPSSCPKQCATKMAPVWDKCGQYIYLLARKNGADGANAW